MRVRIRAQSSAVEGAWFGVRVRGTGGSRCAARLGSRVAEVRARLGLRLGSGLGLGSPSRRGEGRDTLMLRLGSVASCSGAGVGGGPDADGRSDGARGAGAHAQQCGPWPTGNTLERRRRRGRRRVAHKVGPERAGEERPNHRGIRQPVGGEASWAGSRLGCRDPGPSIGTAGSIRLQCAPACPSAPYPGDGTPAAWRRRHCDPAAGLVPRRQQVGVARVGCGSDEGYALIGGRQTLEHPVVERAPLPR